jgi:hypothetical protein
VQSDRDTASDCAEGSPEVPPGSVREQLEGIGVCALSGDCDASSFARLETLGEGCYEAPEAGAGVYQSARILDRGVSIAKCQTCTSCLHLHSRAVSLCISVYLSTTLPGDVDAMR